MLSQYLRMTLVVLSALTMTRGQNTSTLQRISFVLGEFCPTEDVCFSNRTTQHPPESDRKSCCTGCSCDANCHLSMNCCFPKLVEQNDYPETLVESPMLYHSTCIYPFTTIPDDEQKLYTNSYRMITSEEGAFRTDSCGNQIVAPWGSLFPVFSKRKNMIFKNSACADAYDVEDGILWKAFLICKFNTGDITFLNDAATFTVHPGEANIYDDCYVYFEYPADELETHVCYIADDFINTCSTSTFFVPPSLHLDIDEITTTCTSGLMAPFKYGDMFANIFCYICNGNYFNKQLACIKLSVVGSFSRSKMVGFIGLLDSNYLLPKKGIPEDNRNIQVACHRSCIEVGTSACCREIMCPSGKSRDFNGNCYFPTDRWYNTEYEVMVNLTSSHDVDMRELFTSGTDVEAFKHTWPNNWYIFKVFHEIKDGVSRNMIVSIKIPYADIDPNTLILNVLKMMQRQWGLTVNGKFIPLISRFSKLSIYHGYTVLPNLADTTIDISPNMPSTLALPVLQVAYFALRFPVRVVPFCITKLYFCKQVELLDTEYMMNVTTDYLYNKITGRLMLNGEFTLVSKNGTIIPRVCLESSGLLESAGSTPTSTTFIGILIFIFVNIANYIAWFG